jgi:hypothetical protein
MTFPTNSFCTPTNLGTSTSETTIVSADANARNNISGFLFTSLNLVAATVTIKDSTGGTTRIFFDFPPAAAAPAALWIGLDSAPLRQVAGPNNNWTITVTPNATGFKVNTFFVKEFGA